MGQLELRRPTMMDLNGIVHLDQVCLGGFWSDQEYTRELENPQHTLLVVASPAQVWGCGVSWGIADELHLVLLMVHPQYRRRGLGGLLLCRLLQLGHRGGDRRWATLEVRASNEAAQRLYQHFGFEVVGRRPRYYQNPEEDALILWRNHLNTPQTAQELQQQWQSWRSRVETQGWSLIDRSY
ncbi:ribosomal protein S18-alanine N-acetyltransferase [uncultured Thermosynechococcus sp.]|uniref:ribosomal protein S18-alanine N-acetyltransferase n=1 Tax=uncultured Thermosynechococcus sp. TaxID=436945 RepID=UPI00260B6411|nr:ribosomal protein S18-alanine N-acetyltransferase [uncultured Thermosynechococcus sp.]